MDINYTASVSTSVSTEYTKYSKEDKVKKDTDKETPKTKKENDSTAVYEKTKEQPTKGTYKINKMSSEERTALVEQLKQDQENRKNSLIDLVRGMMTKQSTVFEIAFGSSSDTVWKFLASGKFEVDEETRKKAQEDISEDGYYGVKQTSQRMFDFASALAGDDVDKMKEMQKAMEKGYKQAEKTWGGKLPEISQKTIEAANKLFDDYYKSKAAEVTDYAGSEILNQAGTQKLS